jgi:hypothetical protein
MLPQSAKEYFRKNVFRMQTLNSGSVPEQQAHNTRRKSSLWFSRPCLFDRKIAENECKKKGLTPIVER